MTARNEFPIHPFANGYTARTMEAMWIEIDSLRVENAELQEALHNVTVLYNRVVATLNKSLTLLDDFARLTLRSLNR